MAKARVFKIKKSEKVDVTEMIRLLEASGVAKRSGTKSKLFDAMNDAISHNQIPTILTVASDNPDEVFVGATAKSIIKAINETNQKLKSAFRLVFLSPGKVGVVVEKMYRENYENR